MIRTYSELVKIKTFKKRYDYLRLACIREGSTFGHLRHINQGFYHSGEWQNVRDLVIIRDEGCDLGVPGYEIADKIVVHHINPITPADIVNGSEFVFDLDYLICTSYRTHLAIHYGDTSLLPLPLNTRYAGDTRLWKEFL